MRDPHRPGSWGWCPFLLLTGRPCPFCGGLRAVADLERGHVTEALSSNALVVVGVVATAAVVLWWGVRRAGGTGSEPFPPFAVRWHPALLVTAGLVVVAFGVGRWLPPLAWAAP